MDIRQRYNNDPVFYKLVNNLEKMIDPEIGITSLDIRDAAFMARLNYEFKNTPPIAISKDIVEAFKVIQSLRENK